MIRLKQYYETLTNTETNAVKPNIKAERLRAFTLLCRISVEQDWCKPSRKTECHGNFIGSLVVFLVGEFSAPNKPKFVYKIGEIL